MLVNANTPAEIRVALLEDGELAEFFLERKSLRQISANIYKGRVANVEPSLQAAFVELGFGRNGFLHASDCIPPDGGLSALLRVAPSQAPGPAPVQSVPGLARAAAVTGPVAPGPAAQAAPAAGKGRRRGKRGRRGGRRGRARAPQPSARLDIGGDHEGRLFEGDSGAAPLPSTVEAAVPALEPPAQPAPPAEHAPGSAPPVQAAPGRRGPPRRSASGRARHRMLIQEMLHRGQEVLVQVTKEGVGQKGPALTTYLSIPGRFLVLMPAVERLGVSKRIGNEDQRRELKGILDGLEVPAGMGVIARTAGMGRRGDELRRDLADLLETWESLRRKALATHAPVLLYEEGDVVTRVFRDVFSDDVKEIVVDDPAVLERARACLREMAPGAENRLRLHSAPEPLFAKYGVEAQVQRLFHRKVPLKGGGSIVIDQAEAMVVIDVNTGSRRGKHTQDETILATNLDAAREIARQLRLRDMGGLVMLDFVDMDSADHRRRVEQELRRHLARDKARLNVMPISPLGVVEMTRQRVRHGVRQTFFEPCPHCGGTGMLRTPESLGLEILRELHAALSAGRWQRLRVVLNPRVGFEIMNQLRSQWTRLEEAHGARMEMQPDAALPLAQWQLWASQAGSDWTLRRTSEATQHVRDNQ